MYVAVAPNFVGLKTPITGFSGGRGGFRLVYIAAALRPSCKCTVAQKESLAVQITLPFLDACEGLRCNSVKSSSQKFSVHSQQRVRRRPESSIVIS